MAAAIGCDLCQQEPAQMMQSNLGNGETISVGSACMITFFAGALTGMLHDMPPEALNALSPVLAPLGAIIGPGEWVQDSDPVQRALSAPHTEHDTGPREDGGISVPDPVPLTLDLDDPDSDS